MEVKFDVNKALSDLAEGLGMAVEKLYPVLYKQAIIDGVYYIISLVFCILIWYFIYRTTKGSIKAAKRDYDKNGTRWSDHWVEHIFDKHMFSGFIGIFYCVGIVIFGVISLTMIPEFISNIMTVFFNTDYYILNEVIEEFK